MVYELTIDINDKPSGIVVSYLADQKGVVKDFNVWLSPEATKDIKKIHYAATINTNVFLINDKPTIKEVNLAVLRTFKGVVGRKIHLTKHKVQDAEAFMNVAPAPFYTRYTEDTMGDFLTREIRDYNERVINYNQATKEV